MRQGQIQDKHITASSYLVGFYEGVQILNHHYSIYADAFAGVGEGNVKNLSDDHQDTLKATITKVRYWISLSDLRYRALMKGISDDVTKKYENLYERTYNAAVPKVSDVREYVLFMNEVLTTDIMQDLMANAQDLINQVYNGTDNKPTES